MKTNPSEKNAGKTNHLAGFFYAIMHFTNVDETRVLAVRPNKETPFVITELYDTLFINQPKEYLPLFGGFLYKDRKDVNGKLEATEAVITLDVDNYLDSLELESKVKKLKDGRIFLSQSASGKAKAHMAVSMFDETGDKYNFDTRLAARALANIIGFDYSKVDEAGISRAFVTKSLVKALDGDKILVDYDQLLEEGKVYADIEQPGKMENGPTEENMLKATEILSNFEISRTRLKNITKVLAMSLGLLKEGLAFLSSKASCEVLGMSKSTVERSLKFLAEIGVVEFQTEHRVKKLCRLFSVNCEIKSEEIRRIDNPAIRHQNSKALELLENTANRLVDRGVAAEGNYNEAEKKIAGLAIRLGVGVEETLRVIRRVWKGWSRTDRVKRVHSTFKWIYRKEQKIGYSLAA